MDVSRNITHRKLEQQRLRESEARYRAIVDDHQTELICRFLADTTLTFVNETFCQYFDKHRFKLIGTPFLRLIAPGDLEKIKTELSKLTMVKPVNTYENRVLIPKSEIRWLEWSDHAIFGENGISTEFQSVGRDITERKKMEASLLQSVLYLIKVQGSQLRLQTTVNPFPMKNSKKNFEPHLIPHESKRGTGMELSIYQEISRQNKGSISVTSNKQATIYKVILPVEELSYGIG